MTSPAAAASAYANLAGIASGQGPGRAGPSGAGEGGFGDMLQQALAGVVEQGKASEQSALAAVSGKGDVVSVVTAVAESELALETLVSVRDKVIAAYEDVMRMPI
ncbi:flagellar hook-basal body complex protein FliE [Methylopila henanensis]|uniref:Flagellar hook-basal body complex protein FliE n=1 Tax=Methylopila henanensis TaxID=873516 RepID=A0ABW4K6N7_9HYPH